MMYEFLNYRRITAKDAQMLLSWRTSANVSPYMFTQIECNLEAQEQWIHFCSQRSDFDHRIIQIEKIDVGYCSITVRDNLQKVGELGVYIGDPKTPRELSIFNFLGTANHAFFSMGLNKLVNKILGHNVRTLRLQKFNGYISIGKEIGSTNISGHCQTVHSFELTKDRWSEFREKFKYYKDWDGKMTNLQNQSAGDTP